MSNEVEKSDAATVGKDERQLVAEPEKPNRKIP